MVPPTYDVGAARYNLDAATALFFRTPTFYLMWLKGEVYGRFGRRGSLRGVLYGGMLSATWLSGARSGWITAHFDPGFAALAGALRSRGRPHPAARGLDGRIDGRIVRLLDVRIAGRIRGRSGAEPLGPHAEGRNVQRSDFTKLAVAACAAGLAPRPARAQSAAPAGAAPAPSFHESRDGILATIERCRSDASLESAALPRFYEHGAAVDDAVVLFHGFTNCPQQFDELAREFYARGCNVYVPLIPVSRQERSSDLGAREFDRPDSARRLERSLSLGPRARPSRHRARALTRRHDGALSRADAADRLSGSGRAVSHADRRAAIDRDARDAAAQLLARPVLVVGPTRQRELPAGLRLSGVSEPLARRVHLPRQQRPSIWPARRSRSPRPARS